MRAFFGWFFIALATVELIGGIAGIIDPTRFAKKGQPAPSRIKIYFATGVSVAISLVVSLFVFALG